MRRHVRNQFRGEMDFSFCEVRAGADVTLATGLLEVVRVNHRTRIGRWQDIVHAVTTGAVSHNLRAKLRSEAVIAVFVTSDPSAGDTELLRQRYAFMTFRAAFGRNGRCCEILFAVKWLRDVVYAVAIRADGRARNTAGDCLAVDTLHEFVRFGAVTLAAHVRDVHFRDRRLRVRGRQDLVRTVTIGANGGACVAACHRFRVHAFAIR